MLVWNFLKYSDFAAEFRFNTEIGIGLLENGEVAVASIYDYDIRLREPWY